MARQDLYKWSIIYFVNRERKVPKNYVHICISWESSKKKPTYIICMTGRGECLMSEIKVNNGNIEDALKRFKRQCARNGVLQEVRKREHYEKPSVKRKKKSEAARKRKF